METIDYINLGMSALNAISVLINIWLNNNKTAVLNAFVCGTCLTSIFV
jgi:hypothetical protein